MTPNKPTPQDIVGAYLSACRPPINATSADVADVINAWNAVVAQLQPKPVETPKA
jgi:hypothetical protein